MFHSSSIVMFPSRSQYCVAIWPFAKSLSSTSSGATNLPSPCEAGFVYTPPSFAFLSQGELLETTFIVAILEICLPIVLNVSVGAFSSCPVILPFGTRPSLIMAWKPLQIPSASPSLFCKRSSTAALISSFWKAVAKNLALPSGSSPAENPPGNMMI